jgi:hypothetical protein
MRAELAQKGIKEMKEWVASMSIKELESGHWETKYPDWLVKQPDVLETEEAVEAKVRTEGFENLTAEERLFLK